MKYAIGLFIVAVAGVIGWHALHLPCASGGIIVQNAAGCVQSGVFSFEFCKQAFADEDRIARSSGTVYPDQAKCSQSGNICLPHLSKVGGFVRKPAEWCVTRRNDAPFLEPIYQPHG